MFFMHLCKQSSRYKDILPLAKLLKQMHEKHTTKTVRLNGLPDDEHMMFKTCRRHEEMN
jgi:hypothetical protein